MCSGDARRELLKQARMKRIQLIAARLAVATLSLLFTLVALEALFREYQAVRIGAPFWLSMRQLNQYSSESQQNFFSPLMLDPDWGWRATPNYHFDGTRASVDGSKYPARISSDADGFRHGGIP